MRTLDEECERDETEQNWKWLFPSRPLCVPSRGLLASFANEPTTLLNKITFAAGGILHRGGIITSGGGLRACTSLWLPASTRYRWNTDNRLPSTRHISGRSMAEHAPTRFYTRQFVPMLAGGGARGCIIMLPRPRLLFTSDGWLASRGGNISTPRGVSSFGYWLPFIMEYNGPPSVVP